MTAPKVTIGARPATTIAVNESAVAYSQPRFTVGGSASGGSVSRPVSDSNIDPNRPVDFSTKQVDSTDLTQTEVAEPETADESEHVVSLDTVPESDHMDSDSETTIQEATLTLTGSQSLAGETDFLNALAQLDASTGNLPLGLDQEPEFYEAPEFDKENSPDIVEI